MDESIINFTMVEEDPFAKIPMQNVSAPTYNQPSTMTTTVLNYVFFIAELVNFFLGIASVVSDVLIIYFIFRYKRLKKNTNLYIANYALMNLTYYVVGPVLFLIHILTSIGFSYFFHLFCYISMTENTLLLSSFMFATLLGLDWVISVLNPSLFTQYSLIFKYKYIIMYTLISAILVFSCLGCLLQFELTQNLLFYYMTIVMILLIYVHYIRRKKILNSEQLKTEYALWIFTIAVGCFIPIYILDIALYIVGPYKYSTFTLIIFLCEYFLSFLSTPAPVFILYYLMKWNKHFKMAFDTTFKKSVRSYGSDNLDDASDNEEIVEDGQKSVQNDLNGMNRSEILVP